MKPFLYLTILVALAGGVAGTGHADVNELLMFTNHTDEELYIELSIDDIDGWFFYDLYVVAGGHSIADFWSVDPFAPYTVCAYGEETGDFYGCLDGSIGDYFNTVNFDFSGVPYRSEPSSAPAEWFVFDNPNLPADTLVIGASGHHHSSAGCFIGTLAGF